MNRTTLRKITLTLLFLTVSFVLVQQKLNDLATFKNPSAVRGRSPNEINSITDFERVKTRDFKRYQCQNLKRIGGQDEHIKNAPHNLYRLDGAWFICFDSKLSPRLGDCSVLSFGIGDDFTFDQQMRKTFKCKTFSFDPLHEAKFFSDLRLADPRLADSIEIKVDQNWSFYRLGISHRNSQTDFSRLKIGDILNLTMILRLVGLEQQVIDVFKMDIDGGEKEVLAQLDMAYACTYFKELILEAHGSLKFSDLEKLEECFLMFRRDTRFFQNTDVSPSLGLLTEFQLSDSFSLKLKGFPDETSLAEFMFVSGELYFANKNFFS